MPSETATSKVSLSTKPTESRWLAVADLPETATEDTIKECFKRHGRVLSVKIDDQRFAFIAFLDIRIASKAHNAENILDEHRLRTAFHDGSNSVPKALVEPPPLTNQPSSSSSTVLPEQPSSLTSLAAIEPSSSSSNTSNVTAVTNSLSTKTINGDREKRSSRAVGSPDENVRHQVVPVKRDSDSSGSKRKTSSTNISKTANSSHATIQKPPRRKHDNSSSSSSSSTSSDSERSSDDSISCKNRRRNPTKTHSSLNDSMGKSKILKIFHLPSKTPKESLRESIWNLFVDFKKSCRLLTVKIDGEHEARHALLTFRKAEDVDKALAFVSTKSINGVKLKAEPYDGVANENDECDVMKRFICSDLDHDEYSIKATRTLYIGNLQSEISYNELREAYSAHGDIIELEIKRQTQTQHQLPFAFVQYADIKSVVKAMKAFESKLVRDHSIKLGFGKSQPTNVLWLDELPSNVTESSIRNFILCQTSLSPEQVLDIYIDNRNSHKSSTAQCLIYFLDTRAAQQAINLIRGQKIDSKRIQVDFASKVFVTRFSDIIEETSHKKNYSGYPSDTNYHGESRPISKRNGTVRETIPETNQTFDPSSTRTSSSDRRSNAYNNSIRSQHKSDPRHSSDRRHSKEYGKGTTSSLAAIPSADNGTISGSSLSARRNRLSTSSKDSLSNNISSGRNPHRSSHHRHHASSTSSSSSSRSSSPSSSHSSASTTSLEHRSTSYQKPSNNKHSQKTSKKPSKVRMNNIKSSSGKKASSNKEHSTKSSNRPRSTKSEKDNDLSTVIPNPQQPPPSQPDPVSLPNLSFEDQLDSIKKEPSSSPKQQTNIHSSSSPKAPLKNTERVFDWLMQNHHDSNSSMGLDQNDDDEHLLKRKPDEDSLENVSDEQTSKTSPPTQTNNSTVLPNAKSSSALAKNSKNEKSSLASAYRLQPIRTGNKRDDQMDGSSVNEVHLSPPQSASIMTPTLPTPTIKEDLENNINHRRANKTKYNLATNQTKTIPLDSVSSYDQLDVRLKSYPSLFNDHVESIRLPFPQFAFEYIKTSSTSSNVLVVLNPKAHLKHSSLGLNNPSLTSSSTLPALSAAIIAKHDISADTTLPTTNDEDLSTTRIPLDERIRLLDKQMYEMNQGQQKSTASSSSSSSSSSLSPATLIEQQNQKTIAVTPAATTNTIVKSVTERVSTLSVPTPSPTLAQCIQAVRTAALNAQPNQSMSPSKTTPPISATSSFPFPGASVPSMTLNRTLPAVSSSPVNIPSVLTPPPLPPPPPPFPTLQRLPDAASNSLLTSFHAAIAQTQIAAVGAAKYNPMTFAAALHPPPPPVPASLISPSLSLNSSPITPMVNAPSNNNLMSTMSCPPPPPSPSLPNRAVPTSLSSPPVATMSSFPEASTNSPSTSSAKILERLGPSAKFKRKLIPPPLAVVTTPTTPTSMKDSPVLPSPEATTPTHTGTHLHRSPATVSPPVLQSQLSASSSSPTTATGLKSILKQRSLSNPSSLSPTNERKTSTNYVSPLASNETRPVSQTTPTNHRSTSVDTAPKRTPPVTTEKKKSLNQQDNQVYTNDIDERQADEKKSTWRTPPTKQPPSNDPNSTRKPLLDKIPKKASATSNTPKPAVVEPSKPTSKVTKPIKQTPLGTKVAQLNLERLDVNSLKSANEPTGKSNNKSIKLKRANIIQSDSDTDKRSTTATATDVPKTKKSLLNNEITKRKQQHQQKPVPMKKNQLVKTKTKTAIRTVRKPSVAETHSSISDMDDKQVEQTTTTHSEEEQTSSDTDDTSRKGSSIKRTKMVNKNKIKSTSSLVNSRELRQDTSMYDRIKKRTRIEQTRNSSLSTSEGHLSDENSDEDDNDNDDGRISNRSNNAAPKRHTIISDSSDSEEDLSSKAKTRKPTVFDNNVFDAEESDEKTKPKSLPKKVVPSQAKKSILKTNNDQAGKEKVSKSNEESTTTKKKITITKSVDKKKPVVNTTKPTSKISKTTITAQKRPSTDELNESAKKLKVDDEKSKSTTVDEQRSRTTPTHSESEVSTSTKPAIVITSPSIESSTNLSKTDKPSTGTTPQTTSTQFGIVFNSHHRHPTTTPSSIRKQSTETSASHETSKNEDDDADDDAQLASNNNTAASKEEQLSSSTYTLKPPTLSAHPPLSDDETLNPETMQLSDLIGGSRRDGAKPVPSRSSTKGTGKGKRVAKQDTTPNKRQQARTNTKTVTPTVSKEKESELSTDLSVLPTAEQPAPIPTTAKRLSTIESPSISSPVNAKDAKRLRKNTDDLTPSSQIKVEPMETPSKWIGAHVKEETVEPILPSEIRRQEILLPPSAVDQSQTTAMETDQIPSASSLITSINSPITTTTSTETDNAIKALCSSIQISQPSVPKTPTLEKSSPIIAPISRETLPIVEHQPTSITTASIIPSHVPIKSSLTSTTFNENVEETLSAVNSLLLLNSNPSSISGDHPAMKGAARVTPTISKPVYSLVTSLPSPTDKQSRQTTTAITAPTTTTMTTTSVSTPTAQSTDLITMVSNIVSSSNLGHEKQPVTVPTTTTATRSHIEEVIDDVAKGASSSATTTAAAAVSVVPDPTTSIVDTNALSTSNAATKSTPLPHVLRDVMKTPCLTSSTASTTTTGASETLNLFDGHRRSTSPLKTTAPTITTTPNVSTTTTSATPVMPVAVRPTASKTSAAHKRSGTPKVEPPPPARSPMIHPFSHILTPDAGLFAAAAHHPNFPFPLFNPLAPNPGTSTGNPSANLLAPSHVSNSPPLLTRTSSASSGSPLINNPFLNTIMTGQQNSSSTNPNQHNHEKGSRRDASAKGTGTSSTSSSSRSTPIQQTVPVPIALTIPSSSSSSNTTTSNVISQQQGSPLLPPLDAATVAAVAMRQQASPLQPFLGSESVVNFRNVYGDPSELYGAPAGLYQSQNIAYAAAQQMLNVMGMTGSHHPSPAAFAELYSGSDPYYRLNPPTNELSRDPYNVQWQGNLILKNDQAYVKTQLVAGSPQIARASMNYWNSDSVSTASSNLQSSAQHNLRISQRMRLEQAQLEGVQKRMQMDNDHCILIAEPNGSTPEEIRTQQNNLKNGVIRYFDEKKAAGIVNVLLPGASQPSYVVHIFPPCQFASEILQKRAPDTYRCVVQNKIEQIYLLIVITSTVQ